MAAAENRCGFVARGRGLGPGEARDETQVPGRSVSPPGDGILDAVLSVTVIEASPGLIVGTIVSLVLWAGITWLVLRWLGVVQRAPREQ